MEIFINGKKQNFSANTLLLSILQKLHFSWKSGIAVAVNNSVIPRSNWDSYALSERDKVVIIQATQGG